MAKRPHLSVRKTIPAFFIVFFIFCSHILKSQGEFDNIDCLYSKEVIVPFYDVKSKGSKPILDQTVFYGYRDQFSYWYKIVVKEQTTLKFKVSALNDSDSYAIQLFQYNEPDFCRKVFNQKIKPVKPSSYSSQDNAFDLSEKTVTTQKGNTYYISVLNTSKNNCGHVFKLIYGKDTLTVKAVHIPCKRQLTSIAVNIPTKKITKLTDSIPKAEIVITKQPDPIPVIPIDVAKSQTIICFTKDSQKKNNIDAKLSIIEKTSGEQLELSRLKTGEYSFVMEQGKQYKVKGIALGYQNSEKIIDLETMKTQKTTTFDLLFDPLKEGENFVLKSIYFYPNTYALKKESMNELQKLLTFLANSETLKIEIQGHTNGDNRIYKNKAYESLSEEWNFSGSAKKLSQKRAEAIKLFLESNGIASDRVSATGFGGSKPIIKDPETMDEGQQNIRVEIAILKN